MRKFLTTLAATAAVGIATLGVAAPAQAAARYDADAKLRGDRSCQKSTGYTKQRILLDNRKSNRRVQFRVARAGDAVAPKPVLVSVAARATSVVVVTVPERDSVAVRVNVPELRRRSLVLSTTVRNIRSCRHVVVYRPQATLGGTTCVGHDSVTQVFLDNRKTTDKVVLYRITADDKDGDRASVQTIAVDPKKLRNAYVGTTYGATITVSADSSGEPPLIHQYVAPKAC